jgi:hypothetical protein
MFRQTAFSAALAAMGACSAFAQSVVDGTVGAGEYSLTLAVQDTPTGFGDNFSEFNAAFGGVESSGGLRLALTGNLEGNGNGMVIFIDTRAGGGVETILPGGYGQLGSLGGQRVDDWGTDIDGGEGVQSPPGGPSILDPGFNPNYAIVMNAHGGTDYWINITDMSVPNHPDFPNRDVFLGGNAVNGPSATHTYYRDGGAVAAGTIEHAFDNTNTAGVLGWDWTEPPGELGDPLSATTGLEMLMSAQFLNADPLHPLRLMAFITNDGGDYLSNQFLPGLGGVENLGGPGGLGGEPLFDAREFVTVQYFTIPLPEWVHDGDGTWTTPGHWAHEMAPLGVNTNAVFGEAITEDRTITLSWTHYIGGIRFDNPNRYTITSPGNSLPLVFNTFGAEARMDVVQGSHTIATRVWLEQNTHVSVEPAEGTLTLSGNLTAAEGLTLRKTGAGSLEVSRVPTDHLLIEDGTVRILPGGPISSLQSLGIAGEATPTARLDLTNNEITVANGGDVLETVAAQVRAGHAGGSWNGNGITSSTAAGDAQFAVGYAPEGDLIRIKTTYGGDANLSGGVNIADLGILAANWQQQERHWFQGDFNHDGQVNIADLGILAANWQKGGAALDGGSMSFEEALGLFDVFSGVVVPEPAAAGTMLLMGAGLMVRVRRRRGCGA